MKIARRDRGHVHGLVGAVFEWMLKGPPSSEGTIAAQGEPDEVN